MTKKDDDGIVLTGQEKRQRFVRDLVAADIVGKEQGLTTFLKYFDYYKLVASGLMAVLMVYFFVTQGWVLGTLVAIALHLHLFLNQLWWKLRTVEHYVEKLENDKG